MLTFSALEALLAKTSPRESSEIAKNEATQGLSSDRGRCATANFADLLVDRGATSTQSPQASHSLESSTTTGSEPIFANSQTSPMGHSAVASVGDSLAAARVLINRASLTTTQRESRLADLARAPELAQFWLIVWGTESMDLPIDFDRIRER